MKPSEKQYILLKPKPNWMGRFGNNILELINMLTLGKLQNKSVYIPRNKTINSKIINYTDSQIVTNYKEEYVLNPFFLGHTKFFRSNITYEHKKQIIPDIIDILRLEKDYDTFENFFTNDSQKEYMVDPTGLYIHIRSTDVYKNHPNTIVYSQPPLSFYHKIIDDHGFKQIYILSDDNNNFVIQSIKNAYKDKCIVIQANMVDAYNILRKANHLCVSTSSFSTSAAFLSPNYITKNVYTYEYLTNIFHHWFLSDLFGTKNILHNTIDHVKFHIYQINNYRFMSNCNINNHMYTKIDDKNWWKNGNTNFKFNWRFNDETKQLILSHPISDVVKIL